MGLEFNDIVIYYTHCFLLIIVLSDFESFSRKVTLVHILKCFSNYGFFRGLLTKCELF